ncbi:DUF397 domain-containing protein [Actinoallomurus iriomotensis]|uniref:DUF397 domain-containing protein n=1 Tax=Actinoallomurus iriomotensis TaxID=478107 RepID=A0A9W6SEV4_9ACTN|nr:hypothetical protein Airi02_094380 [Actinoallomurus iriomotensis]
MKTPGLPSVHWRKSTYSGAEGGDCVEVADLTVRPDPSRLTPEAVRPA